MEKTVDMETAVIATATTPTAKKAKTPKAPATTENVEVKEISEVGAIKEISEKIDLADSVNKVKATAQIVNTEIKETASVIAGDIKEIGNEVKNATAKTIKDVVKKVDLTDSVEKVKATAKTINTQIMQTASEVTEDIKEKGKELTSTTAKLAKEAIENINVTDRINAVKKAVKNTNEFALETSEELINSLEINGEKWQNVAERAIKSSLKLADRQQDLVFTTLEAVKAQVGDTANRFKKLFQ